MVVGFQGTTVSHLSRPQRATGRVLQLGGTPSSLAPSARRPRPLATVRGEAPAVVAMINVRCGPLSMACCCPALFQRSTLWMCVQEIILCGMSVLIDKAYFVVLLSTCWLSAVVNWPFV